MAKIRHIAIFSDDPANLAEFYADVFKMKINGRSKEGCRVAPSLASRSGQRVQHRA